MCFLASLCRALESGTLLTGQHPYRGQTFQELVTEHLTRPPRDFSETDPEGRVPRALRQVVLAALEKDPEKRIATASEFAERLAPFQDPSPEFAEELDRAMAVTTGYLLGAQHYDKPSSTQDRLDQQFGLETTPEPTLLLQPTAGAPQGTGEKTASDEVSTAVETAMRRLREELHLEEGAGTTTVQEAVTPGAVLLPPCSYSWRRSGSGSSSCGMGGRGSSRNGSRATARQPRFASWRRPSVGTRRG